MANATEDQIGSMELPVPNAVIISNNMRIDYWKQLFIHKEKEATNPADANLYNRCIKLLLWAEFCNGSLIYVGNSKDSNGNLLIKFTFRFPDNDCRFLFLLEWFELSKIVSK